MWLVQQYRPVLFQEVGPPAGPPGLRGESPRAGAARYEPDRPPASLHRSLVFRIVKRWPLFPPSLQRRRPVAPILVAFKYLEVPAMPSIGDNRLAGAGTSLTRIVAGSLVCLLRRAWKRNQGEVTVRVGAPSLSRDRLDLWARFHRHGHETKGWPASAGDDPGMMLQNPFRTEEWTYYVGNRLIAVAYVDALPEALSAIYCYYDPTDRARSLGTYNILSLLAAARERGLPHVYLGYYIAGCQSMEYKDKFRPNEVLRPNGTWEAFDAGCSSVV